MLQTIVRDHFWYTLLALCAIGMFVLGNVCRRYPKLYWLAVPAAAATVFAIDYFSWC